MEYINIYVYIIEVDTGNTDLLYNTVCISVFCNCVKPQNLKPLYICICMYIYMCIYIYMYVWVEVTRPTLYIDDIYIYVCMYLYAAHMFLAFFMQILGFLDIGTQTC